MSLKSALRTVPDDRLTRLTAEAVLRYLHTHRALHVSAVKVASETGLDLDRVQLILTLLAEGRVLDFVSDPPGYRFVDDRVLELETELFLRPSRSHSESLQSNVERYRRLYGGK